MKVEAGSQCYCGDAVAKRADWKGTESAGCRRPSREINTNSPTSRVGKRERAILDHHHPAHHDNRIETLAEGKENRLPRDMAPTAKSATPGRRKKTDQQYFDVGKVGRYVMMR